MPSEIIIGLQDIEGSLPDANFPTNRSSTSKILKVTVGRLFSKGLDNVERILKVTKNPGNRGRCRKLSL